MLNLFGVKRSTIIMDVGILSKIESIIVCKIQNLNLRLDMLVRETLHLQHQAL